jgi:phage terminase large subunit-like protein
MTSAAAVLQAINSKDVLSNLKRENPLAFARLWHREHPKTSQRAAFQSPGELVTIVCGGNRSGKTEGCAQFVVANILGRQHHAVQAWCNNNQIDPLTIPNRPSTVWAVALDSGDSREYLRPAIAKYLPPDAKWRNQYGYGQAEVRLPSGGRCLFKSVEQGRDGFQGSSVDLCWFDEEPNDQAVVNESLMRLVDRKGRMLFSMTPLRGMTWLYDRWIADTPDDTRVHYIHGVDNPHLPEGALERLLRQYGSHERAARAKGEWTTLEGRVYQDWSRQRNVVAPIDIDPSWATYFGIDWGTRAPTAIVVCKVDHDDRMWIVDEYYRSQATINQHAVEIKKLIEKHGQPEWIVCDPEDRGARLALSRDHGIANIPARKGPNSVAAGINHLAERLLPDASGYPAFFVFDHCKNFIREIESYIWDDRGTGEGRDRPKPSQADHLLDAARYVCSRLYRSGSLHVG